MICSRLTSIAITWPWHVTEILIPSGDPIWWSWSHLLSSLPTWNTRKCKWWNEQLSQSGTTCTNSQLKIVHTSSNMPRPLCLLSWTGDFLQNLSAILQIYSLDTNDFIVSRQLKPLLVSEINDEDDILLHLLRKGWIAFISPRPWPYYFYSRYNKLLVTITSMFMKWP